jgi:hypothetical protein
MHPLRRKLTDAVWNGVIYGVSILLWIECSGATLSDGSLQLCQHSAPP